MMIIKGNTLLKKKLTLAKTSKKFKSIYLHKLPMELSSVSKKQNQGFQITIPIISTLQFWSFITCLLRHQYFSRFQNVTVYYP